MKTNTLFTKYLVTLHIKTSLFSWLADLRNAEMCDKQHLQSSRSLTVWDIDNPKRWISFF